MIKRKEQTTAWIIVILGSFSLLPGRIHAAESPSQKPLVGFAAGKSGAAQQRILRSQLADFCYLLTDV